MFLCRVIFILLIDVFSTMQLVSLIRSSFVNLSVSYMLRKHSCLPISFRSVALLTARRPPLLPFYAITFGLRHKRSRPIDMWRQGRVCIRSRPITVAARSKAWTVFVRSNTGVIGSNPTRGMHVCVRLFYVCDLVCVGSGLATGWSPVQGIL
jgi:hypothetical protein